MIVKMHDIVNSTEAFQTLAGLPLKIRTSYLLAKLIKEISTEQQAFQDAREKLIQKYAPRNENGEIIVDENGQIYLEKDNIQLFNDEINELLDTDISLNSSPIDLNDLEIEETFFAPSEMMKLLPFIEIR